MKIKGSVGVARRSDGLIVMHIRDEEASVEFCEIRFTPKQFANAVTGLFGQECEIDVRSLEKVGKRMECKTVILQLPDDYLPDEMSIPKWDSIPRVVQQAILEEHEKNGWKVELGSWGNHHRRVARGYECTIRRWV